MGSTTHWKLRRLAPRALRVLERRKNESPIIMAYAGSLTAKAQAYIEVYDTAARFGAQWNKELAEGRSAVSIALRTMRGWLPLVQRDAPGFDGADYGDKPAVPDDVIEDAGRLHDFVQDYRDAAGQPLAFREACLAQLGPAVQNAAREWAEAEAADQRYHRDCSPEHGLPEHRAADGPGQLVQGRREAQPRLDDRIPFLGAENDPHIGQEGKGGGRSDGQDGKGQMAEETRSLERQRA